MKRKSGRMEEWKKKTGDNSCRSLFLIVFGVSDSTWPLYDLDHGRKALGFYPQDTSEIEPE